MIINITRDVFDDLFTLSTWHVGTQFECYGLEDTDRKLEVNPDEKIKGRTAIPRGEYGVIVSYSPRFKRDLPLLVGVPGFSGVRIHVGNKPTDTDGCLLPGRTRDVEGGWVGSSKVAFDALMEKIVTAFNSGEPIKVVIR